MYRVDDAEHEAATDDIQQLATREGVCAPRGQLRFSEEAGRSIRHG